MLSHICCSLIKMLYWMCRKSGHSPTGVQLKHAIMRNFGGMEGTDIAPLTVFLKRRELSAMLQHQSPTKSHVRSTDVLLMCTLYTQLIFRMSSIQTVLH